jgi:tetratricopeptide (TPR) repeat protein
MAVVAWWGETRRVLAVRRWFRRGALERLGWRPTWRALQTGLGIVVVVAGALTVARWQDEGTGTLWLLLDQSRSQAASEPDGRTRWQHTQPVLRELVAVARRPVAVVVFRQGASVLIPPTRDRQSVLQTLAALRPVRDRQGSDPEAAVRLYERLRQSSDMALLVSDGEWAATPVAAAVPLAGWGLGQAARVPALPGDPATPISRPNPAALHAFCAGHSLWGGGITAADLTRLLQGPADGSRSATLIVLLLALLEAAWVIGQRYQVRLEQLPYRWVQRWVMWRAGTAGVMVLLLLLPAASEVPAWRWASRTSPAQAAYNVGCRAADQGDAKEAEQAWREAVSLDPHWQPAWYNLGTLLAGLPGRQQDALQAFAQAVQLDPTDSWARENDKAMQAAMRGSQGPGALGVDPVSSVPPGRATGTSAGPQVGRQGTPARNGGLSDGASRPSPPQPLPSLKPGDIDRLLHAAEKLSPQALQRLRGQGDVPPPGELPALTAEQWARMAALAARMGVQPTDTVRRDDPTSPYVEPAKPARSRLRW